MEASGETRLLAVLDGMALVMDLSPLGNEALTSFLATTLDQVASSFGGHTGTEAVLAFTGTLGWLIGPFHLFRLKNGCLVKMAPPELLRCAPQKSPGKPLNGFTD